MTVFVHGSDSYDFPDLYQPYIAGQILTDLFPHLQASAAEDMEGELPIGVASTNRAAGPAYVQLFLDEVIDDRHN